MELVSKRAGALHLKSDKCYLPVDKAASMPLLLRGIMAKKEKKERAVPNTHWEKHYDVSKPSKNMEATEGSDFNPKNPTNRKTTYIKVNKEDH